MSRLDLPMLKREFRLRQPLLRLEFELDVITGQSAWQRPAVGGAQSATRAARSFARQRDRWQNFD